MLASRRPEARPFNPYPYGRSQIAKMFREKATPTQKTHRFKSCDLMIMNALFSMQKYGFDFRYCAYEWKQFKNTFPNRSQVIFMRRKVQLKFFCHHCIKNFTSIVGTFQVKFNIEDLTDEMYSQMQNPKRVNYNVRIYRMKCKTCFEMAQPFIYDSQLQACEKAFCLIISEILSCIQPPVHQNNRYKPIQVHDHKEELCQACSLRSCMAIPKTQAQKSVMPCEDCRKGDCMVHSRRKKQKRPTKSAKTLRPSLTKEIKNKQNRSKSKSKRFEQRN